MERAETMARLLDVGYRMSLFPNPKGYHNEWDSVLSAAGASQGYFHSLFYFDETVQNIMKSIKTMLRIICFLTRKIHPQFTAVYRKQETMLYWLEQLLPQRRGLP